MMPTKESLQYNSTISLRNKLIVDQNKLDLKNI